MTPEVRAARAYSRAVTEARDVTLSRRERSRAETRAAAWLAEIHPRWSQAERSDALARDLACGVDL